MKILLFLIATLGVNAQSYINTDGTNNEISFETITWSARNGECTNANAANFEYPSDAAYAQFAGHAGAGRADERSADNENRCPAGLAPAPA